MSKLSAFEAAVQYHVNCELYDRTVCTGGMSQDGVLPANGWERGKINQNAAMELSKACRAAEMLSIDLRPIISSERVIQESIRRVKALASSPQTKEKGNRIV
jgi:hypothetical protein